MMIYALTHQDGNGVEHTEFYADQPTAHRAAGEHAIGGNHRPMQLVQHTVHGEGGDGSLTTAVAALAAALIAGTYNEDRGGAFVADGNAVRATGIGELLNVTGMETTTGDHNVAHALAALVEAARAAVRDNA